MKRAGSTQFNCFSPPVMVATLIIETSLALYSLWRYKLNQVNRLAVLMLAGLATFQLAEYHVCTGTGVEVIPWSRLGFVAITTLPPLGLHLMHVLADKSQRKLVNGAYGAMAVFMGFFLISPVFTGHQCTGNYVIFQFSARMTGLYSIYYYSLLFTSIGLGWHWANELTSAAKRVTARREAVQGMIVGYLVFLVPVALANTFRPQTRRGIPSIMCGFAVLLAMILVGYILPRVATLKSPTTVHKKPA